MDKKQEEGSRLNVTVNLDTTPIFYTDSIHMATNPMGVMFDVMQRVGPTNQVRIVSRIGMSREHAKVFAQELAKLLALTEGQAQTSEKKV